jgi:predicted nucleic acid-binding protein
MFFIDTNVFVYAHDDSDHRRSSIARKLLTELSYTHEGCISTQVVQEFCNVTLRKSTTPLRPAKTSRCAESCTRSLETIAGAPAGRGVLSEYVARLRALFVEFLRRGNRASGY